LKLFFKVDIDINLLLINVENYQCFLNKVFFSFGLTVNLYCFLAQKVQIEMSQSARIKWKFKGYLGRESQFW